MRVEAPITFFSEPENIVSESRLLPFLSSLSNLNQDNADNLVFLYLVSLQLLRLEPSTQKFAQRYAKKTLSYSNFQQWHHGAPDLYDLLYFVLNKETPLVNERLVKNFLKNIQNTNFDQKQASQILYQMENSLRIKTQNYRSIRRIVADWTSPHIDLEGKKLSVTRLLQALRSRAARGDIVHELDNLANSHNWELKDVCDPETGQNCGETKNSPTPDKKKLSLLKQLAITTGIGIGAYYLGKALAEGTSE
jgi:hypothetical protein